MKKKQIKWLVVTGLGIVCIILIAVIASQFRTKAPKDTAEASPSAAQVNQVVVTPTEASKTEQDIQDSKSSEATSAQIPNTAVSNGTKQTIQPDPVKPKAPTISKPKVQPKVTPKAPDSAKKPVSKQPGSPSGKTEPKGGEKKDGKIYVPGFGWVKDNGGGSKGEVVGSDGDINKQVGSMD
ncbi:MAG TPA: DUF6550 family protein [Ruminiclostridium sp.]|nr:DUF6550 family protein [Ruminiclostridium sp.]